MTRALAGLGPWIALALVSACTFQGAPLGNPDGATDGGGDGDGDGTDGVDPDGPLPDPDAPDAPPDPVCAVGEARCTGQTREVCNGTQTGFIAESTCALACGGAGVCYEASNVAASAATLCTAQAPALRLGASTVARVNRATATLTLDCETTCDVAGSTMTTSIPAAGTFTQPGGPPLALFCLSALDIPAGASLIDDPAIVPGSNGAGIVFVVVGDVTIGGMITLDGRTGGLTQGGRGGPGGDRGGGRSMQSSIGNAGEGACPGVGGGRNATAATAAAGGGGGGGHHGLGGTGGDGHDLTLLATGGGGGPGCGAMTLVPLRGGSGGASGADGDCGEPCGMPGGGGGGAIQISATGALAITGEIHAIGGNGASVPLGPSFTSASGGGGGAGGGILLEAAAPTISGLLIVNGGNGGANSTMGGGGGGAMSGPNGGDGTDTAVTSTNGGPGGGGGGGRVRINSLSATPCGSVESPAGVCTSGPLTTTP